MQETLHSAFAKAFALVFEKGEAAVRRLGREQRRQADCQVRTYAADLRQDRTSLRAFSRAAAAAGAGNIALSGAAGVGMGLLGMGLPDVPVLAGLLLKTVRETAAEYGFPGDSEEERLFLLRVIQGALSWGTELENLGRELDAFAQTEVWPPERRDLPAQLRATARQVSETVLYGKILQGVPLVGAVGGAGDALCLGRVQRYAAIKYRKRFLIRRRLDSRT